MKEQTFSMDCQLGDLGAQTANSSLHAFNSSQWKPVQTLCGTSVALKRTMRLHFLPREAYLHLTLQKQSNHVKHLAFGLWGCNVKSNTVPLIAPSFSLSQQGHSFILSTLFPTLFLRSAGDMVFSDSLTHLWTIRRLFKAHLILHMVHVNTTRTQNREFESIGWLSGSQDALDFYQYMRKQSSQVGVGIRWTWPHWNLGHDRITLRFDLMLSVLFCYFYMIWYDFFSYMTYFFLSCSSILNGL